MTQLICQKLLKLTLQSGSESKISEKNDMQPLLDAVIFTIFDGSANGDNEILETDDETSVS